MSYIILRVDMVFFSFVWYDCDAYKHLIIIIIIIIIIIDGYNPSPPLLVVLLLLPLLELADDLHDGMSL